MGLVTILFSLLITLIFSYLRQCYSYWETQGVQQLRPHFVFGHISKLKSLHLSEFLQETYDAFKGKYRVAGTYIFTRPILLILDLDLAKRILIKDFNNFANRSDPPDVKSNPLLGHLFRLHGDEWRSLRTKLSPTFTSGKIKYMFSRVTDVATQLEETFQKDVGAVGGAGAILDLHDLLGRYTVDVIGSCAFGIECNSLKNPQDEFRGTARRLFEGSERNVRWNLFKANYSNLLKKLPIKLSTFSTNHIGFFINIVRETVELRERENIKRNDFMDLLLELRNADEGRKGLTIEQMAAQVYVFFVAGFETSSSNMSFCLFELAKNESIQQKVRSEIQRVLQKHGKLTYEAMMEMTYLDQVVSETLRMYPALSALTRVALEDYQLPQDNETSRDNDITIERGTKVFIPIYAIHHDPEIYPEPKKFQPERFEPEAVLQRHPTAFLGFGDGPRNCIGLRFGRMQVKVGLITLLSAFQFSLPTGESKEMPFDSTNFIMRPAKGVRLRVQRLKA